MLGLLLRVAAAVAIGTAVVGIAGVIYDCLHERIDEDSIRDHFSRKIKEKLDSGDYTSVNVGLTEAEVIDISENDDDTYVAYEVNGERYGLRSSCGTTLSNGETISLY